MGAALELNVGGAGAMGVPRLDAMLMLGVADGVPAGVPEMLPRAERGCDCGELFCDWVLELVWFVCCWVGGGWGCGCWGEDWGAKGGGVCPYSC